MRFHHIFLVATAIVTGLLAGCGGGGGTHAVVNGTVTNIRRIQLDAQDMVYNPTDGRIYASIANSGGPNTNSVVAIDPSTATVTASVYAGSNPKKLALSKDGETLYVAVDAAVQQISLPSMALGQRIYLGNDSFGPSYAEDIDVSPEDSNIIAVSLRCTTVTPKHRGVAIYDNGVRRPNISPGYVGNNAIEFSNNPTLIYGYGNESTDFPFHHLQVSSSGVSVTDVEDNLINGFGVDIEYANGLIYASSGEVINPETLQFVGRLSSGGLMGVDTSGGRVFFLDQDNQIRWYSMANFAQIGNMIIPNSSGTCKCLTYIGSYGLAIGTGTRQVLLVQIEDGH